MTFWLMEAFYKLPFVRQTFHHNQNVPIFTILENQYHCGADEI